jgi:hypothetical protein
MTNSFDIRLGNANTGPRARHCKDLAHAPALKRVKRRCAKRKVRAFWAADIARQIAE